MKVVRLTSFDIPAEVLLSCLRINSSSSFIFNGFTFWVLFNRIMTRKKKRKKIKIPQIKVLAKRLRHFV